MCGWQLTESSLAPSKNAIATKPTDLPSASCDLDLWHLTPKVYRFMSLPPGPLESVRFQNIVFISLTTDEWMKKSTDMLTTLCLVSDCQSRLVEAQKRCTTRKRHHCFNVVHCPIWGLRCGHLWGRLFLQHWLNVVLWLTTVHRPLVTAVGKKFTTKYSFKYNSLMYD